MRVILFGFRTSVPYTALLGNALNDLCDLTIMLPEGASALKGIDKNKVDLQTFYLPRYRDPANLLMARDLLRRINHIKPDLIHTSDWHPWAMLSMPYFLKCPWVSTIHDVTQHPGEGQKAIPAFLYSTQWKGANQLIVHATSAREQLLAQYKCLPEQTHVIPIGSYNFYKHWERKSEPEKPNTILFFGRIRGYKGLQHLIEAEPLITKEIPDARIVIAGHAEDFEKYQKQMINPSHFEVHDSRIPDDQVAHYFQQASVVVLPYIEASQSGVVSVAYAFGKPVVSTKVGGLPDVVIDGQTGLLVPPADVPSLADAVVHLLKNPQQRQQMGENAARFAETELSWQGIARKTIDVYRQALN